MRWPWKKAQSDLDLEVDHHLQMLADAFEQQGMPRREALRRARAEFGGVDRVKEECRDESRWRIPREVMQDVSFGWRMMRRRPVVTAAAVISLALGIGATTALLALADKLLWRSLPVPDPHELLEVTWQSRHRPDGLMRSSSGSAYPDGPLMVADFFSYSAFEAMRRQAAGKAELAAHIYGDPVSVSFKGAVAITPLRPVSGNFFRMLGIQPSMGRLLAERDDHPAAAPTAVVTHRFWRRFLGSQPNIAGQTMRINNIVYVIAGVLPPDFFGIVPADDTEIYVPIQQSPAYLAPDSWYRAQRTKPDSWWMQVIARRKPGVGDGELISILDSAFSSSWPARPKSPEMTPRVRLSEAARGLGSIRREYGNPVMILLALIGTVLLIACANIANLLLARGVERQKEVALRVSLGCGHGRMLRQFLTESLLLAMMGGIFSIGAAALITRLVASLMESGPSTDEALMLSAAGLRSLGFTAAVSFATALLFGLYPAWRTARVDASPVLKEGSGGTVSRSHWKPARLLVLVQVALGVLLVSAAVLYPAHLRELASRETGFERGHVMLFDIRPGELGYKEDRLSQFYFELARRLRELSGVEYAGICRTRPMRGGGYSDMIRIPGTDKQRNASIHHGNAAFLDALGVPLLAGRTMTAQEDRPGAKVAVISEDLAGGLGLGSPLGAQIQLENVAYQVIGVARKARYRRMTQSEPVAYLPFDYLRDRATVVVRTSVPPMPLLGAIRELVRGMDRDLPMVDTLTMNQQISRTLQRERMFAWLCGSFGILALILCVVGLYGLMSHSTARRTPEIGIRLAIGATRGLVLRQVVWEGLKLALAGMLLGIPLAVAGAKIAAANRLLPEGAAPYWTLAAAIALLITAALAAVFGPALRASSVDPMRALRHG